MPTPAFKLCFSPPSSSSDLNFEAQCDVSDFWLRPFCYFCFHVLFLPCTDEEASPVSRNDGSLSFYFNFVQNYVVIFHLYIFISLYHPTYCRLSYNYYSGILVTYFSLTGATAFSLLCSTYRMTVSRYMDDYKHTWMTVSRVIRVSSFYFMFVHNYVRISIFIYLYVFIST